MTSETIQVASLIITILSGIFLYLEKRNKKYDNYTEKYFVEVANSYVTKWKDNQELDTIKFTNKKLKKSVKNNDFYIPKYISYLVNEKSNPPAMLGRIE